MSESSIYRLILLWQNGLALCCAAFQLTGRVLLLCMLPLNHYFPVETLVDVCAVSKAHLWCTGKARGGLALTCGVSSHSSLTL